MGRPDLDDPRRCRATRSDGEPCTRWAIRGASVCPAHGAGAPRVRAAAARRYEEDQGRQRSNTYAQPIEVSPIDALLGELYRTAGIVAWLGAMIADLDETQIPTSSWVALHAQERDRLLRVARDCLAVGIEERLVQLEESKAEMIAQAFRGLAVELGHDPADPIVRAAFRRQLALVRGVSDG